MDGWGGGRGILSLSILFTTGCLRLGRGRKKGRGKGFRLRTLWMYMYMFALKLNQIGSVIE